MSSDNSIYIRFIRYPDAQFYHSSDAVLKITPSGKGYKLEFTDPGLSQHDKFMMYSLDKLINYINTTLQVASMDADGDGRFVKVQVSIPRFPDIMLNNDSKLTINFGKVKDALTLFHKSKN